MIRRCFSACLAALMSAALALNACSSAEPENPDAQEQQPVGMRIVAASNSTEQQVLANLYRLAMAEENVASTVVVKDLPGDNRLEWLMDPETDMIVGCTGELLSHSSPRQAAELSEELSGDDSNPNSQEGFQRTYETLMGTLSYEYGVPDPSPAQGCAAEVSEGDVLPQNILPIFRKLSVNREALKEMNRLTRLITTHDVETLIEEAESSGDIQETAQEWYRDNASI
ncbi:hypothetical protein [Corynebacterium lowii]|uniref:Substrate binding domain of ABC-type glycine betaine transport system n=1 Tax=Corynebacterium lowii TaxID=1544413 RepID=A0A0Q0UEN4_9CORY|nr:hypothetical protein [Corynebacterium lowii]KQB86318.1 hypothetical protein Clow_01237 [Corynebacterium lowii]MDP9850803.1 hypothetical protein [Corynebacterium lowii]